MIFKKGGETLPRYTEEQIEEVRSRSDIVQIIGRHVRLKRSGSNYTGLCPFHSEKTPSFSVSPSRQMYKCFGCGVGGNVLTFVMEYDNLTFPEAMEYLAQEAGVDLPRQELTREQKRQENQKMTLLEINKKAAKVYYAMLKSPQGRRGMEYLTDRGLSQETIRKFGLGYAGQGGSEMYQYLKKEGFSDRDLQASGLFSMSERGVYDKFWNRVMFPIMDANNRVIGFGGRVMGDAKPKYLNSPETPVFDKSRNLFGLNYAKRGNRTGFILCEGYMDVISMHQAGFTQAVASLGTAFTEQQANLIRRYVDEVLLCYDSDGAGVKAALRAIPMLRRAGINGKVVHMDPYKDPDEFIKNLGAQEFQKRLDDAQNSFLFEIEILKKGFSMEDPEQRTRFVHETARRLLIFTDKIQRDNYLEAVASAYSIKAEDLRRLVIRYGNQMPEGYEEVMQERGRKQRQESRNKHKDGIGGSYRLLLSWLVEEPELYPKIKPWVTPADFMEEIYAEVAGLLYQQLEEGEVVPARIINHYEDPQQQGLVASMFQTSFHGDMSKEDKEKALSDLVRKIKEYSIEKRASGNCDLEELQRMIREKKLIQDPKKIYISL